MDSILHGSIEGHVPKVGTLCLKGRKVGLDTVWKEGHHHIFDVLMFFGAEKNASQFFT